MGMPILAISCFSNKTSLKKDEIAFQSLKFRLEFTSLGSSQLRRSTARSNNFVNKSYQKFSRESFIYSLYHKWWNQDLRFLSGFIIQKLFQLRNMVKFASFILISVLFGPGLCQDYEVISCNSNENNVSLLGKNR